MDIKRLKFERTGGFAGIRLAAEFDLNDLPAEQADQLRKLLDNSQFDTLPENLTAEKATPDGFTYCITAASGEHQHSVTTTDGAIPEKMQPLIDALTQIAREQMTKKK